VRGAGLIRAPLAWGARAGVGGLTVVSNPGRPGLNKDGKALRVSTSEGLSVFHSAELHHSRVKFTKTRISSSSARLFEKSAVSHFSIRCL